jgi:hypothetical protein
MGGTLLLLLAGRSPDCEKRTGPFVTFSREMGAHTIRDIRSAQPLTTPRRRDHAKPRPPSSRRLGTPATASDTMNDVLSSTRKELEWLRKLASETEQVVANAPAGTADSAAPFPRPPGSPASSAAAASSALSVAAVAESARSYSRSSSRSSGSSWSRASQLPPSRISSPASSVRSATSSIAIQLQRAVPLVDECGRAIPLTDWLVGALLRRAQVGGVSPVIGLRALFGRIDRRRTGMITTDDLVAELADSLEGLHLARPMRSGPRGSPMISFRKRGDPVGPRHIAKCFARWNGGGSGKVLRYASGNFAVVHAMLGRDYPRKSHNLGATTIPDGCYLSDVCLDGVLTSSADMSARRFHNE